MSTLDTVAPSPWYRSLTRAQWKALIASNLGWTFDGFEVFALILTVGVALHQLLDPSQYPLIPAYAGAVRQLIARTGSKYKSRLVFVENKNYGYERNLLGMRSTGLIISVVAGAVLGLAVASRHQRVGVLLDADDGADDGQLVPHTGLQWEQLADLHAGDVGGDRLELAADTTWRLWLEVERFLLRRAAPHEQLNATFGAGHGSSSATTLKQSR